MRVVLRVLAVLATYRSKDCLHSVVAHSGEYEIKVKFCCLCPHWMVYQENTSCSCGMFSWYRGLVCAGQRAPSLSTDPCMCQLLLCSMLGPEWKNKTFVDLEFFYRMCAFSPLVSLPVLTLFLTPITAAGLWTVWCGVHEVLVRSSHCKNLGVQFSTGEWSFLYWLEIFDMNWALSGGNYFTGAQPENISSWNTCHWFDTCGKANFLQKGLSWCTREKE